MELTALYANMLSTIPSFFESLLSMEMIMALLWGIISGMLVGALPGLNSTLGVSLLLPMTYVMSPVPAMTMLMAIYTATITGGSFTAIMIHTPGTPSNMATLIDGYQLTQRGEGHRALSTSLVSSTIGSIVSGFALLLISPLLAKVALMFDSPEYFLIAIFGVAVIASLSDGAVAKGFAIGFFGILVSCVGVAPQDTVTRYHFGTYHLMNGFTSSAVLLGMFSMSQVLIMIQETYENRGKKREEVLELQGSMIMPKKDFLMILPTIIRSSIIGIFTGIFPGAGANIGSYLGYSEGKRWAKDKENYGKGSIEGVAAPEAANNAVTGGAMVPLLTLGIPGSPAAAVLLGGLMIHGLIPGASLFTTQASITYPIIYGFILASVLMFPIGLVFVRVMKNVAKIPNEVLVPVITVLVTLGAYSLSRRMFDVYVVLGFAFFGFIIRKAGFPTAGFALGQILGTMAEMGIRRAAILARGDIVGLFLSRPGSVLILVLLVVSVAWPAVKAAIARRKAA